MTIQKAIQHASGRINRRDAETLLLHLLGQNRAWLLAHPESEVAPDLASDFEAFVRRRAAHEPLQYLTGQQEFFGLALQVTPAVLIPRPETELLVEAVLAWAHQQPSDQPDQPLRIADVGTGSGAIALALAAHLPTAHLPTTQILALDLSPAALAVARGNAARLGLTARVRFLESDLLGVVLHGAGALPLDVVVSNPPYVPETDAPVLQPEVRDHEPHTALFAGRDGLAVYRRLIPEAHLALRSGGLLALEFGFGQREALAQLLRGWNDLRFLDDLAGIPRVALAHRP